MLTASNDLEDKFKALEGGGVDDELAAMKINMLGAGKKETGTLPEGRPVSEGTYSLSQILTHCLPIHD